MTKERKDIQTTVKMSPTLRSRIDAAAKDLGISSMEYIRRACEEKLNRDENETPQSEIRKIVIQVLDEVGVDSAPTYL